MKSRFPVRAYIAALLMSAGIFFLVSCSQNESENGKKYSQADNVSVSADPGQTPASTPGEKIPPPQNAEVATPAKVATTGQTPADPVETGMNMIYDKLAKLNDKQFKQFADEHHGIPGVSYIQGADGKMLRSIENPANKPQEQEPMTIGQYNAQTQRISAMGNYGSGVGAAEDRKIAIQERKDYHEAQTELNKQKDWETRHEAWNAESNKMDLHPTPPNGDVNGDRRAIRNPDGSYSYDNGYGAIRNPDGSYSYDNGYGVIRHPDGSHSYGN